MNQNSVFPGSHPSFLKSLPPAVKGLLLVNIAVFLIARLSDPLSFDYIFGLTVPDVFTHFRIYQFVTYLFIHGDFFHLLFNMLILFIFGRELELYWGTPYFLRYYFISGIGAGICSIPFVWGINAPLIGASGALFALLAAYGMLFPNRVITLLLFFIIPVRMKARQMVLIFIGLELLFLFHSGGGGGIAHFAHLGGALVGFIYLKWPLIRIKIIKFLKVLNGSTPEKSSPVAPPGMEDKNFRGELDRILDKLAQVGWGGLSKSEKEYLHDAKNQL
ncbi:MAG: rhomboid family intramembrane serine protease [Candidatus Auribacterota bacterium]|nr:rhomboid family intramembrane serine protease [Candidatus Auribacterota bacterium]